MNSILIDSREPWPHPWAAYFSDAVKLERGALETGDLALSALPDRAVVERKTVGDLLACIGRERERFERELKRSRYAGRFMVIVEGTFGSVLISITKKADDKPYRDGQDHNIEGERDN